MSTMTTDFDTNTTYDFPAKHAVVGMVLATFGVPAFVTDVVTTSSVDGTDTVRIKFAFTSGPEAFDEKPSVLRVPSDLMLKRYHENG